MLVQAFVIYEYRRDPGLSETLMQAYLKFLDPPNYIGALEVCRTLAVRTMKYYFPELHDLLVDFAVNNSNVVSPDYLCMVLRPLSSVGYKPKRLMVYIHYKVLAILLAVYIDNIL